MSVSITNNPGAEVAILRSSRVFMAIFLGAVYGWIIW